MEIQFKQHLHQVVLNRRERLPRGVSKMSREGGDLTRSKTWEVSSISLPINIFAFTTYLMSEGLETKDNYLSEAW